MHVFYTVLQPKLDNKTTKVIKDHALTIKHYIVHCHSNSGKLCTDTVTLSIKNSKRKVLEVKIDNQFKVTVNGQRISDTSLQGEGYSIDDTIFIRRASTLFMEIETFGCQLLFDLNGKLYIRLQPVYANQV